MPGRRRPRNLDDARAVDRVSVPTLSRPFEGQHSATRSLFLSVTDDNQDGVSRHGAATTNMRSMIGAHGFWNYWRLAIGRIKRRFVVWAGAMSLPSVPRRIMFRVHTNIAGRPQLNAFMKQSVARFPPLDRRLRAVVRTEGASPAQIEWADLTPHARQVYLDLVDAVRRYQ